jgi:hypothetical protein
MHRWSRYSLSSLFVAGLTNSTDDDRIQASAATHTHPHSTPVSIDNKVGEDINPDGLQNAGEPGWPV